MRRPHSIRPLPKVHAMSDLPPRPTLSPHSSRIPLGVAHGPAGDVAAEVPDETHRVLVSLVRSYITLVKSEWPAVCRRDPDFSVETAHNYGLGLIRMLAEYQVANGIDDRISVRLALELAEAKRCAERRVREPVQSTAEPKPSGAKWRRGYRRASPASRSVTT